VNIVIIAVLTGVAMYVGKKWLDTRAENAELRTTIAFLKRRLKLAAN
jgi:hypothetical protein